MRDKKKTYTLDEIAERWSCSHSTVLTHVYDGTLRAIDISTNPTRRSRYIVPEEAVLDFENRRTVSGPPPAPPKKRVRVKLGEIIEFIK